MLIIAILYRILKWKKLNLTMTLYNHAHLTHSHPVKNWTDCKEFQKNLYKIFAKNKNKKYLKAPGMATHKVTGAMCFQGQKMQNRADKQGIPYNVHWLTHTQKSLITFQLISWSLWNYSCLQHLTT